jgi:DNA-binding GntR family transcriptional regulator
LPNRRLSEEIARYVRDGIVTGAFGVGERIYPRTIAAHLSVSTMPVREALVVLGTEGLLEALPRRGFRVAPVEARDIKDVFTVHAFVAGLLAAEACESIRPETVAHLEELQGLIESHARTRRNTYAVTVEKLNFEFHRTVNLASNSNRLRWFLRLASRYVPRHFYESIPGWVKTTLADHPAIIDAFKRRDRRDARALMEAHVQKAGNLVMANIVARRHAKV